MFWRTFKDSSRTRQIPYPVWGYSLIYLLVIYCSQNSFSIPPPLVWFASLLICSLTAWSKLPCISLIVTWHYLTLQCSDVSSFAQNYRLYPCSVTFWSASDQDKHVTLCCFPVFILVLLSALTILMSLNPSVTLLIVWYLAGIKMICSCLSLSLCYCKQIVYFFYAQLCLCKRRTAVSAILT